MRSFGSLHGPIEVRQFRSSSAEAFGSAPPREGLTDSTSATRPRRDCAEQNSLAGIIAISVGLKITTGQPGSCPDPAKSRSCVVRLQNNKRDSARPATTIFAPFRYQTRQVKHLSCFAPECRARFKPPRKNSPRNLRKSFLSIIHSHVVERNYQVIRFQWQIGRLRSSLHCSASKGKGGTGGRRPFIAILHSIT